jgi:3-polyprenyl-4-hydroxybenzoate decarboxylase
MPPDLVDARLSDLPLLTYAERDACAVLHVGDLPGRASRTPACRTCPFHRSMYVSDDDCACRLAPRHHLTLYHEKAEAMGRPLEAAMLIGPPPQVFLAAAAPVPYEVDELEVAAQLRARPIDMRPCRHIDLHVPASTEIVVEGRFLPSVRRARGTLRRVHGLLRAVGDNAVFEVLGVTMRRRPSSTASLRRARGSADARAVGRGQHLPARERGAARHRRRHLPAVRAAPVVKIRQQYEGTRARCCSRCSAPSPRGPRLHVVDEDVNIYDMNDVMWAVLTRSRPDGTC